MKRRLTKEPQDNRVALLKYASELAHDELHRLREELDVLYTAKACPLASVVFSPSNDIFSNHILSILVRSMRMSKLARLRLVCICWRDQISAVSHLDMTRFDRIGLHDLILKNVFPVVDSLRAHCTLLHYLCVTFSRIRSIEIEKPLPNERHFNERWDEFILTGWISLQSLVFPTCEEEITGLATLTGLTSLDIDAPGLGQSGYDQSTTLGALIGLKTLRIRNCPDDIDFAPLTALTDLDSDRPLHFLHYTGKGTLDVDSYYEDEGEDVDWAPSLAAYHPKCYTCCANGEWKDGVFTGHAFIQFGDHCDHYEGDVVDGKRNGHGEEVMHKTRRAYIGEWSQGLRHGPGHTYTWLTALYWGNFKTKLLSTEQWHHGLLTQIDWEPDASEYDLKKEDSSVEDVSD